MLVVDKPAGMVTHPGAGRSSGTLAAAALAHAPTMAGVGGPRRPGIVHRLDKGTSGLIVLAKTAAAYDALTAQLARRSVTTALPLHRARSDQGVERRHRQTHRARRALARPDGRRPGRAGASAR